MTSFEHIQLGGLRSQQERHLSGHRNIVGANKQKSSPEPSIHTTIPPSLSLSLSPPFCFYHPSSSIIFFCCHPRCTLPLCQKCLPIHRSEHLAHKEIPMENIMPFQQSKQFILQYLKENTRKVTSNHKYFGVQLMKYREKIMQIVDATLQRLKKQLLMRDQENSVLRLEELQERIENIEKENSLNDVIKGYEVYYLEKKMHQEQLDDKQNQKLSTKPASPLRANSLIDNIKLIPDQPNLIKTIQRGFLNCRFIKSPSNNTLQPQKISRQQYLKTLNSTPTNKSQEEQHNLQINNTPIATLNCYLTSNRSQKKSSRGVEKEDNQMGNYKVAQKDNQQEEVHVFEPQNGEMIDNAERIMQIKRQERPSIFKDKPQSITRKSVSFTDLNINKSNRKLIPRMSTEQLFSDVKKYSLQQSQASQNEPNKKPSPINNIYTQNLNFPTYQSSQLEAHNRIQRSSSNQSFRKKGKGLSLMKKQGVLLDIDHYRNKQKDSVLKIKEKLKINNYNHNQVSRQTSNRNRDSSLDWKRVVNLSDSNASYRQMSDRQNADLVSKRSNLNKNIFSQNSLSTEVLNPMQMRQLLLRKKMSKAIAQNTSSHLNIPSSLNIYNQPHHNIKNSRLYTEM